MATNEYTEYRTLIPGSGSLFISLKLKNEEPGQDGKTIVSYIAAIHNTGNAQWYNLLSETPMDLQIAGVSIYNTQRGNFDTRTKKTQVIQEGTLKVDSQLNQIDYHWSVDARSTYRTISGVATVSGQYEMPVLSKKGNFTLPSKAIELGQALRMTLTDVTEGYRYYLYYSVAGKTYSLGEVNGGDTTFTLPNTMTESFPDADKINVTIRLVTMSESQSVGISEQSIEVDVSKAKQKPTLRSVSVSEGNLTVAGVMRTNGYYLSNLSQIRVTVSGETVGSGASVRQYRARIKNKPGTIYTANKQPFLLPRLPFPTSGKEQVIIQVSIVDSRNNTSEWVDSNSVTLLHYTPPTLGIFASRRGGDNTNVLVKRNWSVSSIAISGASSERNTATLEIYTRKKGEANWTLNQGSGSTALRGANSETELSGTFEPNVLYEFKAILRDRFSSIESAPIPIATEAVPMSWGKDKVAVGGIVDKTGATLQLSGNMSQNGQLTTVPKLYELKWNAQKATTGSVNDEYTSRRYLAVNELTGIGIIHLDLKIIQAGPGPIATLPSDAPTPQMLIELPTHGGTVYIPKGSRNIIGVLPLNQRIIVDLIGFFNVGGV